MQNEAAIEPSPVEMTVAVYQHRLPVLTCWSGRLCLSPTVTTAVSQAVLETCSRGEREALLAEAAVLFMKRQLIENRL